MDMHRYAEERERRNELDMWIAGICVLAVVVALVLGVL